KESSAIAETSSQLIQMLDDILPSIANVRVTRENEFYKKHGEHSDTPAFRQFHSEYMCAFPASEMDASRQWEEQIHSLRKVMTSVEVGAASAKSLLLIGPAGVGKTHSIVSAALRRLEKGANSLVVFGDDF